MATKKKPNFQGRMQAMRQRRGATRQGKADRFADAAAKRQKGIESRVGKKLIVPEAAMVEMIRTNKVPTMIKHCVLALLFKKKKRLPGTEKERFISAFNICCASFATHGYLDKRGSIRMTGRGMRRNRCHQREKVSNRKKGRYNGIVTKLWTPHLDVAKSASLDRKREAKNARARMARMRQRRQGRKP